MTQQILVPIDGSVSARQALAHACLVQRATQARIHLLHVPEVPVAKDALGAKVGAAPADYTPEKGRLAGERLLEEADRRRFGRGDLSHRGRAAGRDHRAAGDRTRGRHDHHGQPRPEQSEKPGCRQRVAQGSASCSLCGADAARTRLDAEWAVCREAVDQEMST